MQSTRIASRAALVATLTIPTLAVQVASAAPPAQASARAESAQTSATPPTHRPAPADDRAVVAELDRVYQAAVERNDAAAMERILHPDFVLVLGDGRTFTGTDLLEAARTRKVEYERQVEVPGTQVVRVEGDTAVVTALLWERFTHRGEVRDQRLWFTDTYVRTPDGWRYWFGQASLPLPAASGGASDPPR